MAAVSAEAFDASVRHAVLLERLKAGQTRMVLAFLREMDREVRLRLSGDELTSFRRSRLEGLLDDIGRAIETILRNATRRLTADLRELSAAEAAFEARALSEAIRNPRWQAVLPAPDQITAAVFAAPLAARGAAGGKLLEPFLRDFTQAQVDAVVGTIRRGVFEGRTNAELIRDIRGTRAARYGDGILAVTQRQAEAVVRTAVQHVSHVARLQTLAANSDAVKRYEWVSTLDNRTSEICRSLSGQQFPVNEGPVPPAHINCLPGDSFVLPCGGITGASKRWFDGEVVVIKTAGGRELTCTPNHPVLTSRGWFAADLADVIGDVACCLPKHRAAAGFDVNHQDKPAPIEQIFDALLGGRQMVAVPVPVTAEDFHGDGLGSEVAVIATYRLLRNGFYAFVKQELRHFFLKARSACERLLVGLGLLPLGEVADSLATPGGMSSRGEGGNFFRAGGSHSGGLLFGAVPQADIPFPQDALNGSWTDAEFIRDAADTHTGGVFFDDVVSVERRDFSGHVYNLQTTQAIYFAGDIVTHNCRSTIVPVLDERFAFLKEGATQSSQFGPVDRDLTYYEWLKRQPAGFQDSVLGTTRGKLLRNGGLSAERFAELQLSRNFKPLTLAEMQRLEPLAFERANIELNPDTGRVIRK